MQSPASGLGSGLRDLRDEERKIEKKNGGEFRSRESVGLRAGGLARTIRLSFFGKIAAEFRANFLFRNKTGFDAIDNKIRIDLRVRFPGAPGQPF